MRANTATSCPPLPPTSAAYEKVSERSDDSAGLVISAAGVAAPEPPRCRGGRLIAHLGTPAPPILTHSSALSCGRRFNLRR